MSHSTPDKPDSRVESQAESQELYEALTAVTDKLTPDDTVFDENSAAHRSWLQEEFGVEDEGPDPSIGCETHHLVQEAVYYLSDDEGDSEVTVRRDRIELLNDEGPTRDKVSVSVETPKKIDGADVIESIDVSFTESSLSPGEGSVEKSSTHTYRVGVGHSPTEPAGTKFNELTVLLQRVASG